MNAIIIAAGMGTRLNPLTLSTPKPLIKIFGKPMIEKNIEYLLQEGIEEIVIVTGYMKDKFEYLRDKYKQVPFIGIEPAIKPAGLQSITKKIGVLATRRTLTSDLFAKTSEHLKQEEKIEIFKMKLIELTKKMQEIEINRREMKQVYKLLLIDKLTHIIDTNKHKKD